MPRYREKYTLVQRKTKSGRTVFLLRYIGKYTRPVPKLADYAKDFFLWGTRQRIASQHTKGQPVREYQAKAR
jgi:hypothetical protein